MSLFYKTTLGGRELVIETGKLAGQADGTVTVTYGGTVVMVTVCISEEAREGIDFFPLTVDFEERMYAAGKIPGGFIRREGRPTQEATLAGRLTDRAIRPLFPKGLKNEVQVIMSVLSHDQENDPDVIGLTGASAALMISRIPFEGPLSAVRVGYVNGEPVINPTYAQLQESRLDLVVASTKKAVVMIEAGAREVSEDDVLKSIKLAHEANQSLIALQEKMRSDLGKQKISVPVSTVNQEMEKDFSSLLGERFKETLNVPDKTKRDATFAELKTEVLSNLAKKYPREELLSLFEARLKEALREYILRKGERPGGRKLDEIRSISCEVGILPRTHGSGLFTRGQTQVLTLTTLGSLSMKQKLDSLSPEESKRFIHHYNFPPYSTGEVKRVGTTGRREIGHGALVERALLPFIPREEAFPYAIRLVSEVLSSNGSTSQASICASTLSLMDAGVPITEPVAGVAIGLLSGKDNDYVILTDIEGIEDFYGDMDFKIAGTKNGISAIQMDTKLKGLSFDIIEKAVFQARSARLTILEKILQTISQSRSSLSPYAPRMYKITIDPEKIGALIGPGGKNIRSIIETTKTSIDVANDGSVVIGATNEESAQKAIKLIEGLTKNLEPGEIYTGKVTRILNFGALVEILPGKEGLVHISELADYRVGKVEDEVKLGDEVTVKVLDVDRMGKISLSRKAVFETAPRAPGARMEDRGPRPSSGRDNQGPPPFRPRDNRR